MREEKCEIFVVYEKQHFEPIQRYKYIDKNMLEFQKKNKITIKWAIDISDFDIEIIKNEF